jgi:hypothetical protein
MLLSENGFEWSTEKNFTRAESFTTLRVKKNSEVLLKLDFVNDSVPLFGEIERTNLYYRTDSIRNILSNKLSAIFRFAAKDVVDIREIALHENIDWVVMIQEARQKEAGLELTYIAQILTGMPRNEFDTIAWVKKPDWEDFKDDINKIAFDILTC